jgi:hypothetical protein
MIMYQNKVTLIGFIGSNSEVRNNGSFTTLSLATKSSYKKNGGYIGTRSGTVAWSSVSSRSSPKRSVRAHISRSKANYAAGSMTARRRTPGSGSGKSESLRSSRWIAPNNPPQRIRMTRLRRILPHGLALFTVRSPVELLPMLMTAWGILQV